MQWAGIQAGACLSTSYHSGSDHGDHYCCWWQGLEAQKDPHLPKGIFGLDRKKKKQTNKKISFFPLQYVMGISSSQSSGHSTSLSNWAGCWWVLGEPPPPPTSSQGLPAGSRAWRGRPLSSPRCHTPAASGSNGPPQAHHRRSFSKRTEEPAQTFCSWARPALLTSITSSHGNLIL